MAKINKICCAECGSTNVNMEGWVDVNTLEFQDSLDEPRYWCNVCEEDNGVSTVNEYKQQKKEEIAEAKAYKEVQKRVFASIAKSKKKVKPTKTKK